MIAVVATIRVQHGREAEFEAVFAEATAAVRANEPGARLYQLTRTHTDVGVYKVLELYADAAALQAHRESDHFKRNGVRLRELVSAPVEVEVLDAVG